MKNDIFDENDLISDVFEREEDEYEPAESAIFKPKCMLWVGFHFHILISRKSVKIGYIFVN